MKNKEKVVCEICGKEFINFKSLTIHLRIHKITSKYYYDQYFKDNTEGKCIVCGKETRYRNIINGYKKYCSGRCVAIATKEKAKQTYFEKTGYNNPSQNPEVKKQKQETMMKNHSVKYALQSKKFRKKASETTLKRTGFDNASKDPKIKQVKQDTCFKNFGVKYPMQSKEVRKKSKETCLEKYGVENPQQNYEIIDKTQKNSFNYKDYIMPSGEIRKVQGYENFALDILIDQYDEKYILTHKGVPTIKYFFDNKNKVYHPDIYIYSENLIIEVKSEYTYETDIKKNLAKQRACLDQGYRFEFWILDNKGNILNH